MNSEYHVNERRGIDLSVYHCGMEICKSRHSYGPAVRDHYLIHYILKGKGRFSVGGRRFSLREGEGFLICPDVVTYYEADEKDPWVYTWVGFQGLKAEEYLLKAGLTLNNPIFAYGKGDFIKNCFSDMMVACKLKRGADIRLQGILYLFLSELIENHTDTSANKNSPKEEYLRKAVGYIVKNYSRNMSINELSSYVGLNRSYFSTIFTDKMRLSPQAYLVKYRMDKACELMNNENLSISDIARSVGYEDQLGFSKMFKKVKGVSPKNYRKAVLEEKERLK